MSTNISINPITPRGEALILEQPESVAIAQAIYAAVTGKTEKVSKTFKKDYLIGFHDIQQLHMKCTQACNQWHVIEQSHSVVVHHIDDNTETFSSFERFKAYDISNMSPTAGVIYEINILLKVPAHDKPQNYKVTVRMHNKTATLQKLREDGAPPAFLRFMDDGPIRVDIEYVDYVIARNILSMIESWVKEVATTSQWSLLTKAQRYAFSLDDYIAIVLTAGSGWACYKLADSVANTYTMQVATKWVIMSLTLVIIFNRIGNYIGQFLMEQFLNITEITNIKLNKGDEKVVSSAQKHNAWSVGKALGVTALVALQSYILNWSIERIAKMAGLL